MQHGRNPSHRMGLPMDAATALRIRRAAPRNERPLPPPVRTPRNRAEMFDVFLARADAGYQIFHPADDFKPNADNDIGFAGSKRTDHGRGLGRDLPPELTTAAEMMARDEEREALDEYLADRAAMRMGGS